MSKLNPIRDKTLEELQGPWGEPSFQSHLILECHRLSKVALKDFNPGDLRIMIGQQIALKYLVPLAIDVLQNDPLIEGTYFPGDLANAVFKVERKYWQANPKLLEIAKQVAERIEALAVSQPDEAKDVIQECRQFLASYAGASFAPAPKADYPVHVLFICSMNRLRSPTAEQVFGNRNGIQAVSAGLNHDAENPLTPDLVEWAHVIFVMENAHRNKLQKKFKKHLNKQRLICLGIPDDYDFMDPELIRILVAKVTPHLP
jgi:predicted protein tyrosine phosphatase